MITDFLDQKIGGSPYFKWREALYLKQWDVHVFPETPAIYLNILEVVKKLDLIRDFLGRPMVITSWYRPEKYNTFIKGAFDSAHRYGMACDFICSSLGAQNIRDALVHRLEEFDIRMENLPNSSWVHIDIRVTDGMAKEKRFFYP